MKPTRLFSSLLLLVMTGLLAFVPFGRAAAQTGPVTGEPAAQPATSSSVTSGPAAQPATSSPVTNGPAQAEQPADGTPTPASDIVLAYSGCARVNVATFNDYYEQRVVELTNIERAKNSQPPLKRNVDLDYAARFHAKDMADDGYFEHDSYDGSGGTVLVCKWSDRVKNFFTGDGYMAENIAAGYSSPESVVQGWIDSPGHHNNMISPNYREIGAGYYAGGKYSHYWVQDFGRRSGYYPLIINNDAYATTSNTVSIYLYGQGTWAEMRLSNDGTNWTSWQTFQPTFNWTLPCTLGTYTVYAQMRRAGSVNADTTASDSVILQGATCPTFGNLPNYTAFLYDQSTQELIPSSYSFRPGNTSSSIVLNWTASKSGFSPDWLTLSGTGGATPNGSLTISTASISSLVSTQGDYAGTLTFKASCSTGEVVNNATIPVSVHLVVVPKVHKLFLPSMGHP